MIAGVTPAFSLIGYRHLIKIKINQSEFEIPVLFVNSEEVPQVLGKEGIFEHFYIIFDEKSSKQFLFRIIPILKKR